MNSTIVARNAGTVSPIGPPSKMDASGNVPVLQVVLKESGYYVVMGKGLIANMLSNPSPGQGAIYFFPSGSSTPTYIDFSLVRLGGFGDFATDGGVQQCISLLGKHDGKKGDVIFLGFQTTSGSCSEYSLVALAVDSMYYYTQDHTGKPQSPVPGYTGQK